MVFALKDQVLSVQDNDEKKLLTRQETSKMLCESLVTLGIREKKIFIPKSRIIKYDSKIIKFASNYF